MFERFKKIVGILAFACLYCLVRFNHDFSIIETIVWWIGLLSYGIYLNLEND